ncbi:MAG: hypothetical protein HQM10_25195 [Candidatus Riflebacteria bacterium]|nr:hypothetical protein [Candidatus Riflebacteria bacterium]
MKNEILEELWSSKDEIAKQYNYCIEALAEALRKEEIISKVETVDLTYGKTKNCENSQL